MKIAQDWEDRTDSVREIREIKIWPDNFKGLVLLPERSGGTVRAREGTGSGLSEAGEITQRR